ncbi:SA1362 family protein [Tuberibacillus calidus]|uniref:SA1362 family protein n=1 Tax=Tuberibacillus calidus TaxID=340097 RepID=UPI000686547D|nr:SA1362 family protein [Tuberibacillus calidus]
MRFSWSRIIFYLVIALAAIGLFTSLFRNPVMLFTRIIIGAAVIGIILFVFYVVSGQNRSAYAGYRKAVRQSKRRLAERERSHTMRKSHLHVIPSKAMLKKRAAHKRAEHAHLKVIDGKKKGRRNSSLTR